MSNELVPYSDISKMALCIAKSGLFGIKSPEQAIALMLIAQADGLHPAAAARDYEIVNNRPVKRTEAMLRDFLRAGGTVQWHELSDTMAKATFSHSSTGKVTIDWDLARAKKAGLGERDMYKKYPRAMLRSRCVSEGIKATYPAATGGMYTPEEAADIPAPIDVRGAVDVTDTLDQWSAEQQPDLLAEARSAALHGVAFFRSYWVGLSQAQRNELRPFMDELEEAAKKADEDPEAVGR